MLQNVSQDKHDCLLLVSVSCFIANHRPQCRLLNVFHNGFFHQLLSSINLFILNFRTYVLCICCTLVKAIAHNTVTSTHCHVNQGLKIPVILTRFSSSS